MAKTNFRTERQGDILVGTFAPEGGAASFSLPLLAQIDAFCKQVEHDQSIRAAIITGTGKTFSIGTDMGQIERGLGDFLQFRRYLDAFNATMHRLEKLPVPTVAAVNGMTRAGGLEIVLCCDFSIIAQGALIGDIHSAQFALPAGGSTQRLPRKIGMERAKALIWNGQFLSATESVEWGLCYRAVPADGLIAEAKALLATFIDKPRPCLAESKSLMARSQSMSMEDGVELEIQAFLHYVQNYPFVRNAFEEFRAKQTAARKA